MQYPSIKIDEVGAGRQLRKRLLTYILPIIATSIILVTPEYLENEIFADYYDEEEPHPTYQNS